MGERVGERVGRVQVVVAAEEGERELFARVVLELMQRLSVEVEVEAVERIELAGVVARLPAGTPYLARCFVDLRGTGVARLYVHDPGRDRILERRVARGAGEEELAREQLGHMLLAAIEALLAGATLGDPRTEVAAAVPEAATVVAEPAPPVRARPVAERSAWGLRAGVLYELTLLGHGPGLAHGPAVAALIRSPPLPQLGVLLSAQYRWPFEVEGDPIGMRMHSFALRALLAFEQPLSARVVLRLGLGGGADVAKISPEASGDEIVELTDARTLALGVTRALVAVELRASRAFGLWAALAADADLERTEYVLVRSDGDDRLSAPWRVRPSLSLGVVLP